LLYFVFIFYFIIYFLSFLSLPVLACFFGTTLLLRLLPKRFWEELLFSFLLLVDLLRLRFDWDLPREGLGGERFLSLSRLDFGGARRWPLGSSLSLER
jgi:hypothetical protein